MDKRKKDPDADLKGEERLAIALMLVLGLLIATIILHPQKVSAASRTSSVPNNYSCLVQHCYGVNDWPGHVGGAFTAVDVVHLTPGTDGVIDNELWIADKDLQCQLDPNDNTTAPCDVEGGYVWDSTIGYEQFF